MGRIEAVKQWVEKTKVALMEEERKQAIIEKFREIFGIEPDTICWNVDQTLEAKTRVKDELDCADIPMVLDRKVKEVNFVLLEEKHEFFDEEWRFEKGKRHWTHYYCWWKRFGFYTAIVEIFAKIS